MKNISYLIKDLRNKGINIKLLNQDLEISIENDVDLDEELLEQLKQNKNNIKVYLQKKLKVTSYSPIPLTKKTKEYPLSSAQRRLWVLSKFKESSIAYNMPSYVMLDGHYDVKSFEKSIEYVIERHEILRTVFKENDLGEVFQRVLTLSDFKKSSNYNLFNKKYTSIDEALEFIKKDSYRAFCLENGPLIRSLLFQVADYKYIFYFNMHHIISDGWSMDILTNEIMYCYNNIKAGTKIELPTLKIQYKDFASWELKNRFDVENTVSENYWKERLKGDLQIINLPSQKRRPKIRTFNGKGLKVKLSIELTSKIKNYSQQNNSSLFVFLLSSLKALLFRYTGEQDIIIGSPVSGREHPDLENQIGFYVNTLIFRNRILGTESFQETFNQIKNNTLEDFKHQNYPYDKLLEVLQLKRDLSRNPIFDIMLALQSYSGTETDFLDQEPNFEVNTVLENDVKTSRFDLLFNVVENKDDLIINTEYNTDVYDQELISNVLLNYVLLLEKVIEQPELPIGELDFLNNLEREELLYKLNATKFNYNEFSVLKAFDNQVIKSPNSIALICNNDTLSYQELSNLINQLANNLIAKVDIKKDTNIGVLLKRSLESVISMLAIMRVGACYVPIDYKYPLERKSFIIKDANLKYVITHNNLNKQEVNNDKETIWLDIKEILFNKNQCTEIIKRPKLNPKAFIIYTSGSTGNPKGVIQTSQMLSNLIAWNINHAKIDIGLKYLQYASFSFDVSLQDTFFNLCSGGTLYIANEDIRVDFSALLDYIVVNGIEVLSFPFSVLSNLFTEKNVIKLDYHKIKHIISSGEQLLVNKHLNDFLKSYPYIKLHNHYGPSETHVVTSHSMSYLENNIENRPSIGKPISNTTIYILNDYLKLVPKSVQGEIYVSGYNLADGYVNLPNETKSKFVKNPYNLKELLYKTGDIGRWLNNGTIEYIGRNDDQVKIRGYRIEVKEIEEILLEHQDIEDVVITTFNYNNTHSLSAYLISNKELKTTSLREYLNRRLPHYMIPSYFVQLDKIPLTSNGKVDKKKLPSPILNGLVNKDCYVAPITDLEVKMVALWQEVLKVNQIGLKSNFFDLGGNSFLAISLISKMEQQLGFKCNLRDLLMRPTIALLLEVDQFKIEHNIVKTSYSEGHEISELQKVIWYEDQINGASQAYNVIWKLPLPNIKLSKETVTNSFFNLMKNEPLFRSVFIEKNGSIVTKELDYKKEFTILKWNKNSKELYNSIDILTELPIKVYFNEGQELIIKCHHIVVDGYSVELINNRILEYLEKGGTEFSDLKYNDYISYLKNENLESKTGSFWKQYLRDKSFPIPLNIEQGEGKQFSYLELDNDLMLKIKDLTNNQITLPVIQSIIQLYFHKLTKQKDIIVGTTFNGRNISDTKNIIGLFSTVLPIVYTFENNKSFKSYCIDYQKTYMSVWDKQYCSLIFIKSTIQEAFETNTENLINVLVSNVFASTDEINAMIRDFKSHKNSKIKLDAKFKINFKFLESHTGSSWIIINSNTTNVSSDYLDQMALDLKNMFTTYMFKPDELILEETEEELTTLSEFTF